MSFQTSSRGQTRQYETGWNLHDGSAGGVGLWWGFKHDNTTDDHFDNTTDDHFDNTTDDYFDGKLVWQIYGSDQRLNLRGYDIAGLAVLGCDIDGVGGQFDTYIQEVVAWAKIDEVPEVAHVEFGCVGRAQDISTAKINLDRWHHATSAFATGLIVLDEPTSAPNSQQVVGTWLEDWVVGIAVELGFK